MLPITNFTEEIKEDDIRKRGKKDKDKGKDIGAITDFTNNDEEGDQNNKIKPFSNNSYIYLSKRN
jgi:hypothetical protein